MKCFSLILPLFCFISINSLFAQSSTEKYEAYCKKIITFELNHPKNKLDRKSMILHLGHITPYSYVDCFKKFKEFAEKTLAEVLGKKYCLMESDKNYQNFWIEITNIQQYRVTPNLSARKEIHCTQWKNRIIFEYNNLSLGRILGLWEKVGDEFLFFLKDLEPNLSMPFLKQEYAVDSLLKRILLDDLEDQVEKYKYEFSIANTDKNLNIEQAENFIKYLNNKTEMFKIAYANTPSNIESFSCLTDNSAIKNYRKWYRVQENLDREYSQDKSIDDLGLTKEDKEMTYGGSSIDPKAPITTVNQLSLTLGQCRLALGANPDSP